MLALLPNLSSQQPGPGPAASASPGLPDSPQPQVEHAAAGALAAQNPQTQNQSVPQPASTPAASPSVQGTSSSQSPAPPTDDQKSQHQKGEEEIKEEEQQRVVGVVPNFNVSYRMDTVSLSAFQKIRLAFHSAIDPATFAAGAVVAGYHEAMDDDTGFGWGYKGYAKRAGAAYLDAADGDLIGNGLLPALFRQEPRYLRLGHGAYMHRTLYSIATNFVCPHDNTHKWEPNYSNVGGNLIAGAISNFYYPSNNNGVGLTIENGIVDTAEGAFGTLFEEFWPDISRRLLHRDPTQGRDAEARALDAEEKQARQLRKQKKKKKQEQDQNPDGRTSPAQTQK